MHDSVSRLPTQSRHWLAARRAGFPKRAGQLDQGQLSITSAHCGKCCDLGRVTLSLLVPLAESVKSVCETAPIIEVLKKQPREIILSALLRMGQQAPFYIFTAFIFAYAVGILHLSRKLILSAVLVASCISFVSIPLFGHISDRIGRRKTYLIGAGATGLFGFLYFGMVDTAIPLAVFIAIVLSLVPHDMQYGPQAALIAEAFTPGCATAVPRWAINAPQ